MKASIITVAFNSASTIRDTLSSVSAQTHPDLEHLVIDGGSTDGTQALVRQCGSRVAEFISEPDSGIYDAMNKGLRLATGDIVCFLNADDRYADATVLERVVRTFDREHLDAVFGDVALFREQAPHQVLRRYRSGHFHPKRLAWGWMPAHPALFMQRVVFQRVGPFRSDYRIAGDFEFIARAFKDGTLRYRHLPEILVMMRAGGVSTAGWRNTLLLNREVLRACRENGIESSYLKILSKYPAKILEYFGNN